MTSVGRFEVNTKNGSVGGLSGYIIDSLLIFSDKAVLANMGVRANDLDMEENTLDHKTGNRVLESVFDFWRHLAGLEILFVRTYSCNMPGLTFWLSAPRAGEARGDLGSHDADVAATRGLRATCP